MTQGLSPNGLWRTKNNEQEVEMTEIWILLEFCDMGTLVVRNAMLLSFIFKALCMPRAKDASQVQHDNERAVDA